MKRAAWLATCLLFAGSAEGHDAPVRRPVAESRFAKDGVEYHIRAEKFEATTAGSPGVRIAYTIRRDGKFLHPADPNGGRQVAAVFSSEQKSRIDLAPFPDAEAPVGWSIRCGPGIGNGSSELAVVILPMDFSYDEVVWPGMNLEKWTVVRTEDSFELWSFARDDGCGPARCRVDYPERRVCRSCAFPSLERQPLDPDWTRWPDPYGKIGFRAAFAAGLRQENPALMRAALGLWRSETEDWVEDFGLPQRYVQLTQLVETMEDLVASKTRARALCPLVR